MIYFSQARSRPIRLFPLGNTTGVHGDGSHGIGVIAASGPGSCDFGQNTLWNESRPVSPFPPQGRRAINKAMRKRRILDAARVMIRESGDVGFSMRGLAERAGLSVMTLYNLVGSQQDILLAILIEDMVTSTWERESAEFADALDEMFDMIPFIRSAFSDEFRYRRSIILSLFQKGAEHVRLETRNFYMTGWRRMFENGKTQGVLRATADIATLLIVIDNVYTANIFSLSAGDISEEVFEARAQFGFAVAISSVVSRKHAWRVDAVLKETRRRCRELEPAGSFAEHDLPELEADPARDAKGFPPAPAAARSA